MIWTQEQPRHWRSERGQLVVLSAGQPDTAQEAAAVAAGALVRPPPDAPVEAPAAHDTEALGRALADTQAALTSVLERLENMEKGT